MQLHSGNRPTVGAGRVVRNAKSASGASSLCSCIVGAGQSLVAAELSALRSPQPVPITMQLHSGCGPIIGTCQIVRNAESAGASHLLPLVRSGDRPTFPQVAEGRFRQNVNFYDGRRPTVMQLHSGNRPTIGAGRVVRNAESASSAILYESTERPGSPFPHLGKCRSVVDSYKTCRPRRPRRPRKPPEYTSRPKTSSAASLRRGRTARGPARC